MIIMHPMTCSCFAWSIPLFLSISLSLTNLPISCDIRGCILRYSRICPYKSSHKTYFLYSFSLLLSAPSLSFSWWSSGLTFYKLSYLQLSSFLLVGHMVRDSQFSSSSYCTIAPKHKIGDS